MSEVFKPSVDRSAGLDVLKAERDKLGENAEVKAHQDFLARNEARIRGSEHNQVSREAEVYKTPVVRRFLNLQHAIYALESAQQLDSQKS